MAVAEVSAFPVEQRAQRVRPAEVSVVVPVFNEHIRVCVTG